MAEDNGEVRINRDTVSIPLFVKAVNGKPRQLVGRTLVDLVVYNDTVKNLHLYMRQGRKQYADCLVDGKLMPLSHVVAGKPPTGHVKDHINGKSLDNRCINLRDVTPRVNSQNRVKAKGTTSKYVGVCWSKQRRKWMAQANGLDSHQNLGAYTDELEAAKAYDKFVLQSYGLEGKTNGLLSQEEIDAALAQDNVKQAVSKKSGLPRGVTANGKRFRAQFVDENGVQQRAMYDTVEEAKAKYDAETERVAGVLEAKHLAQPITRNAKGDAIIVTNQRRGVKREVLVSEHQWHDLTRHAWSWTTGQSHYPHGEVNGELMLLHRYVWQLANPGKTIPEGHDVDHMHQDPGDCRVESLRLISRAGNNQNRRKRAGTSSQYIGVSLSGGKWQARISVKRKQLHLGTFDNQIDAARAYNDAVDKYYSEGQKNVLPSVRGRKRVRQS